MPRGMLGGGASSSTPSGPWTDCRAGQATLSVGTAITDDVQIKSGDTATRDSEGIYLSTIAGTNWDSYLRFRLLEFARSEASAVEMIVKTGAGIAYYGISSPSAAEGLQYYQSEVAIYQVASGAITGVYGNSGTPGSTGSQLLGASQQMQVDPGQFHRLRIERSGRKGALIKVFPLPSGDPADWEAEDLLGIIQIAGTLDPDEPLIFPNVVVDDSTGTDWRIVAVRVTQS